MEPIPKKYGDPGPCLVSCCIGGRTFHYCMCDLEACVSIMPLSIFVWLNLAPLKKSAARFALANKSVITVTGIAKDVLVAIKDLVFPVDFYILEMPPTENKSSSSILLGRPFLKTSKLDAFAGTYSFEVGDKTIKFNLEEAMKHPPEEHSILRCVVIDEVVAGVQEEDHNMLCYHIVEETDDQEGEHEKVVENELRELDEKELQLEGKSELKPLMCGKRSNTKLTGKCTGSHQVIITHMSEVDPTEIEGLSNFSLVVDLVKRIKFWLSGLYLTEAKLLGMQRERGKL
ncbi:hypothetical protein AHAS_Ahas10G0126900 [Arachis hypogaea]